MRLRSNSRMGRTARRQAALATELALVLPFLVFAVLVVIDFCRLYHVTQTLTGCANVGAYHASGAGMPPTYRPPTGGLLPIVTNVVGTLLGGQTGGQAKAQTNSLPTLARKAALAEGASLQPPLREDQVTVTYQGNSARVTVTYTAELITPVFGGSRTVQLSRTVTMAVINSMP